VAKLLIDLEQKEENEESTKDNNDKSKRYTQSNKNMKSLQINHW
jgi:hypothetical protein